MEHRKRFYKSVATRADPSGFVVELDGRMLRSPAKTALFLPTQALATSIAAEWESQTAKIDPATMPLFSLAVTVIDRVTPQRAALIDELVAYGGNDLLCYHAEDNDLSARQRELWDPWLGWARKTLNAPLHMAAGLMPLTQPEASLCAFDAAVKAHDDWELGMLHRAVALGGSLVLGLAFLRGEIDQGVLFETAFLEELWQSEKWGQDYEAEDRRRFIRAELDDVARFLALLRGAE